MHTRIHTRSSGAGFSVVELMVAVAISMLLLTGVVAIFMSSRASYDATERLSRVQENGRFALDEITRQIRAAGYAGCARFPKFPATTTLTNANQLQFDYLSGPIRGFQATGAAWAPALDISLTNLPAPPPIPTPEPGSDILVVRVPARDAEPMAVIPPGGRNDGINPTDPITVPNVTTGVQTGDVALIYSCERQTYFHVTSFGGGVIQHTVDGVNDSNSVGYQYRGNAEIMPMETVVYFIRQSPAAFENPPQLPPGTTSLWRMRDLNPPEEIVEGVERMELQFGVDTNADGFVDVYRTANNVSSWNDVITVSVALLVRSLSTYNTDSDRRTYQLLDVVVPAPNDTHMREVFTTTATLRNRAVLN